MKIKKTLSLILGVGLAFTSAQAQYCMTLDETINVNFNGMPHGGRPECWLAYSHVSAIGAVHGVSSSTGKYHMEWPLGTSPANTAAPGYFELSMHRCTMKGVLTFKLARTGDISVSRTFLVGSKTSPGSAATFTPFQTITHNSLSESVYTVDFSNFPTTNGFIVFRANMSNGNGFTIDDISWSGPPASIDPEPIRQ